MTTEVRPGKAAWYLIFVLTLAFTLSFVDRQVLNLLVGPIKQDTGLSDTQVSLLQGFAFTVSYILMSPIFGRLADLGSRRKILIFGVALWSIGTTCCGLARNYVQLFMARFGVGGAEASLTPAAWSLITESFPERMLPRAFSIYLMGPYLGGGLALIFGGLLLDSVGSWNLSGIPLLSGLHAWQLVFILVGLPGLLVALLLVFIREPDRDDSAVLEPQTKTSLRDVWRMFVTWRGFYGNFYAGMSCIVITLYAFPAWMPTVLIRRFGASVGDVGIEYGVIVLLTGSLGVFTGPWIAKLFTTRGRVDHLLLIPTAAAAFLVFACLSLTLINTYGWALAVASGVSFLYSLPQALSASALQLATPKRMRGIATAVYVFAVSIIGLGAAPTIVALITDRVYGDEMRVAESLAYTCAAASLAGFFFLWNSLRYFRRMIDQDLDGKLKHKSSPIIQEETKTD